MPENIRQLLQDTIQEYLEDNVVEDAEAVADGLTTEVLSRFSVSDAESDMDESEEE